MRILVAYSGGKDSQASLLWAVEKYGAKNIEAVFCDTKWENPITYDHIHKTCNELGVHLTIAKSEKYDGFVDLAIKKGRFPSTKARFCTEELKTKPMINKILDIQDNVLVIQGIRKDESFNRSLMAKQCRYFKYYFEPYQTNSMRIKAIEAKKKPTRSDLKKLPILKQRLSEGKEDPKYHTYRKKEVIEFCKKYSDDLLRPVFEWTAEEVITYILLHDQEPNPLYKEGFSRVGCFPCIMANHGELKQIISRYPKHIEELIDAEKRVKSTLFRPDYIPKWYLKDKDKKGNPIATLKVVRDYLNDKNATIDMFEESNTSCMSFYGLCE